MERPNLGPRTLPLTLPPTRPQWARSVARSAATTGVLAPRRGRARTSSSCRVASSRSVLLAEIARRVSDTTAVHYILQRVAVEVKRLHTHLPEKIKLARATLAAEERRELRRIHRRGQGHAGARRGAARSRGQGRNTATRAQGPRGHSGCSVPGPAGRMGSRGHVSVAEAPGARNRPLCPAPTARPRSCARLLPCRPEVGRRYYRAETAVQVLDVLEGRGRRFEFIASVEAGGIEPPSEAEDTETLSDLESPGVRFRSLQDG
jgi:hypothetical protein